MNQMDLINILFSVSLLLFLSKVMRDLLSKWQMPVVAGEILLGILIGPTWLGNLSPAFSQWLFPTQGLAGFVMQGLCQGALLLLLFAAGLEVQLKAIQAQGKSIILTTLFSMVIPFIAGLVLAILWPSLFHIAPKNPVLFATFIGIAMAISALPVIIRILMDLGLYQTKIGSMTVACASLIDMVGWIGFSLVLSGLNQKTIIVFPAWQSLIILGGLGFIMFLALRQLSGKPRNSLKQPTWKNPWLLGIASCFVITALAQLFQLHTTLGVFFSGILLSPLISEKARKRTTVFLSCVLSPLFFISIGAQVNFATNLDPTLITVIIFLAVISKLSGTYIGGRLVGLEGKEAFALGFALNARGAMEIILSRQALAVGLIQPTHFVALVIMALFTSLISGPALKYLVLDH
jgi:Kef-type K+ transport system membrane component KefB